MLIQISLCNPSRASFFFRKSNLKTPVILRVVKWFFATGISTFINIFSVFINSDNTDIWLFNGDSIVIVFCRKNPNIRRIIPNLIFRRTVSLVVTLVDDQLQVNKVYNRTGQTHSAHTTVLHFLSRSQHHFQEENDKMLYFLNFVVWHPGLQVVQSNRKTDQQFWTMDLSNFSGLIESPTISIFGSWHGKSCQ